MIRFAKLTKIKVPLQEIVAAILLGCAGFGLNMVELQLGWGMHFIFGNALVFAFLRIMRPAFLTAAVAIASVRSILLWHHPWAWGIWTIEAAALSYLVNKSSPIRIDVAFWLLIGAPLLVLTYGGFMGMDRLSLLLVIAKQTTNGVLNVAVGEIIYAVLLTVVTGRMSLRWPRMPIEAFVLMILMSIILIPTTVYLALDAPARELGARSVVQQSLSDRLQVTSAALGMWQQSRSMMLIAYADERGSRAAAPETAALLADFEQIAAFDARGRRLWSATNLGNSKEASVDFAVLKQLQAVPKAQLSYLGKPASSVEPRLTLVVPFDVAGQRAIIAATLKPDALGFIIGGGGRQRIDGIFLVDPASRVLTINSESAYIEEKVRNLPPFLRSTVSNKAVLVGKASYGSSLMSDLKDALMVQAMPVQGLAGWNALAVTRLSGEVMKAREEQLQLFMALCAFVVLITALGSLLSGRIKRSLRELAQSAADLAMTGVRREQIDGLVIRELSDISINIATVGSQVARERGALVSYQRRLRSIAKHAPVVVYAFDVTDEEKGELIYVSDALAKILGYTPQEFAKPGWWNRAIHPEDYDHYHATFGDLQPGKAINLEYRLRHKHGHYVWVYDNLAVEIDPFYGRSEAVGLIMDITDRKMATAQLLQADKMASLGRMVAGIAHELNQPLNFIKMASLNLREHAARGRIDAERCGAKLENILAHVNRASAIILQMRVFGRTPTEIPHPMAVREAVDAVMTMIGPQLEADGIHIDRSDCAADVTVRALPVLLEQVFLNLLLNAHDAIHVRQAGEGKGNGWIKIAVRRQNALAVITVEDNGPGLSDEIIPVLFEPFFTTKPPKDGTGLGLSISYGIIRDLGGNLRAENAEHGARFIIELPLDE